MKLYKLFTIMAFLGVAACTDNDNVYVLNDCLIEVVDSGQRVTCGGQSVVVPDQMPILAVVDPCGDGPGHDEVLLVMDGGLVLAWYKDLGITPLLEYQRYVTTDQQRCNFQIVNGQVEEL